MDPVYALGMAASSFGLVMASAPLLQARTIWRGRSSDDVSQSFLAIIAIGAALWAVYGFADRNWFIFVPNVVAVATNMLTLVLARRFAVAAPEDGQPAGPSAVRAAREARSDRVDGVDPQAVG